MRYDESDVMFLSRKISNAIEECGRGVVTGASKYIGAHRWSDKNVSATFPVTTEQGIDFVALVSLFDDQSITVDFFTTDKSRFSETDRLHTGGNIVGALTYGVDVENTLDFSASAKAIVDLTEEITEDVCDICELLDEELTSEMPIEAVIEEDDSDSGDEDDDDEDDEDDEEEDDDDDDDYEDDEDDDEDDDDLDDEDEK